jgi:hypothetical protein
MSDAVEAIKEEPETAPSELLADSPSVPIGAAPASDSWEEVQALLDDFDQRTAPENNATEQGAGENGTVSNEELDKFIADLSGPTAEQKRIGELEGEIGSLRNAELERQSRADFEGFARKLQAECGNNVDDQFARTALLSAAMERPELQIAWQHRHITDEQLRAADQEFRQLESLYQRVVQAPPDPRKQQAVAMLEQRGYQLGLLMNSRKILNDVWRDVVKRAKKAPPEIDIEATLDRDMIAQSIRDGQGPAVIPQAPVRWGSLSAKEGREKVLRDFGFDPGWGH